MAKTTTPASDLQEFVGQFLYGKKIKEVIGYPDENTTNIVTVILEDGEKVDADKNDISNKKK